MEEMEEKKITNPLSSISEQSQNSVPENYQSYDHSTVGDNIAEGILSFIAYTILFLGIVTSLVIGWLLILADDYEWDNIIGWVVIIGGVSASFIIWASLMVIINISNNIRQIKYELRNMEY